VDRAPVGEDEEVGAAEAVEAPEVCDAGRERGLQPLPAELVHPVGLIGGLQGRGVAGPQFGQVVLPAVVVDRELDVEAELGGAGAECHRPGEDGGAEPRDEVRRGGRSVEGAAAGKVLVGVVGEVAVGVRGGAGVPVHAIRRRGDIEERPPGRIDLDELIRREVAEEADPSVGAVPPGPVPPMEPGRPDR
jgi:hypothetical protein